MTNEQKKQVRDALMRYVSKCGNQTNAAETLEGVGSSTISLVKNGKWDMISDRLWQNIARQVGFYNAEWQPADMSAYLLLRILFSDAQHYNMTYGIAIGEGLGKTFSAGRYLHEHPNAHYLAGTEEHNKKTFMMTLLNTAGICTTGSVPEMMELFIDYLTGLDESLLIFDDVHKLKDRVLQLVVMLANRLTGKAGVVIMGADKLQSRILDGLNQNKPGFEEMYANIGKRFITLGTPGPQDVELICRANGVTNEEVITEIKEESRNNLHITTQLIQQYVDMAA
jgi:DNA transposition AAA+ family ATPase